MTRPHRGLLLAAAALSLLSLAIPWTLSGQINTWERIEFAAGAVALILLPWHPRIACDIGAVVWMSAVTDYLVQLVLGTRDLSTDPGLVAGIGTWAVSSSLFLFVAGEVLHLDSERRAGRRP
jgi:hypothetical protein